MTRGAPFDFSRPQGKAKAYHPVPGTRPGLSDPWRENMSIWKQIVITNQQINKQINQQIQDFWVDDVRIAIINSKTQFCVFATNDSIKDA
jgi:hypothetical protein